MQLIYSIFIQAYYAGIRLAALFNPKAKLWINGRKQGAYPKTFEKKDTCYWFHCASLGEFEQARPLIEALKEKGTCQIILTFFSPSGYEVRKNYSIADWVGYIPYDNKKDCKQFLNLFQPDIVIMVKYEFWFNMLEEIQNRKIKLFLISGLFRDNQIFFTWYGKWFKSILEKFSYLFVQNKESIKILHKHQITHAEFCGDTRLDRVLQIKENAETNAILEDFSKGEKLLIFGSVWPQDIAILENIIHNNSHKKILIAPHNLHSTFIEQIAAINPSKTQLYSKYNAQKESQVLILDTMGMLASAYKSGQIAYIGGGFGAAIHNTMEPAAFGLAIVFGPKHKKFHEALELLAIDAAKSYDTTKECAEEIQHLIDYENVAQEMGQKASHYVQTNSGASKRILAFINE